MSDAPTGQDGLVGDEEATLDQQPVTESTEPEYEYLDIDDDLGSRYVRVPVDGEEQSVPLREALQGYQRQADYTRKTQEVARQREEAANALQLQRAFQANPGMTVQILADRAGMSVQEFLGLSTAQQQQQIAAAEDEYIDPLEVALAQERQAREALEQRFLQREADEQLRQALTGLRQQFQIDDEQAREVVGVAYQMGLPPSMLPMVYQSMAFQRLQAQSAARQEDATNRQIEDARRQAAALASQGVISNGASVNGVQGTPANQEFTNYRDAIVAAFEQHGGPV